MDKKILIKDYWYELPQERIATYPLPERDQSKLLVYKDGQLQHSSFLNIGEFLPPNCTLFFNNTRVIPARLFFQKETGAIIELFLLSPVKPSTLVQQAMEVQKTCQWVCMIGNLKRWPASTTLIKRLDDSVVLEATLINREEGIVEFTWHPSNLSFAEIISLTGNTPLPPYLNRDADESDKNRYQTIYAKMEGAVAAPTAGLHFTDTILNQLVKAGHTLDYLTLHVSAGTFQPVKTENAWEHSMHSEQIIISRQNIERLLNAKTTIAVGTTSLRSIESLYWYGVKLSKNNQCLFEITQHEPYQLPVIDKSAALNCILEKMVREDLQVLVGETSIMIAPGYQFQLVDALITNFHQPGSTLMLLVAAFVGPDWKRIYQGALENNYRFLSYGDSSLLLRRIG